MTDLLEILESGHNNLVIQVRGEDLLKFTEDILERSAENERTRLENQKERDILLTKDQVMTMLSVCSTTLWNWESKHYLKPVKAGRKVMCRKSDIDKLFKDKEI